jgi:hypothetical protein
VHLRQLACVDGDVQLELAGPITQRSVLDELQARYPMPWGTIRDHVTGQCRPFLLFFACRQDRSHEPRDAPLPEAVASAPRRDSSSARSPGINAPFKAR